MSASTQVRGVAETAVRENSDLPNGWELKRLGEIGEPVIGLTYSPSNVKRDGLLVLRSSNVDDGALVYEDNVFVDLKVPPKLVLREDDLLICVRNGSRPLIGKSALIDKTAAGMTFGAFMSVFRSPHNRFVFQCFQSGLIKQQIDEHLGATINQITNKSLRSFKIPFPPPAERAAIVQALADADSLIGSLDDLIEKKQSMKLGAMQKLLSGETRLPGFAGEWRKTNLAELGSFFKGRGIKADEVTDTGSACIRYGELYTRYHNYVRTAVSRISLETASQARAIATGDLLFAASGETPDEIGVCAAYIGDEPAYVGGDIIVHRPIGQDPVFLAHLLNSSPVAAQKARLCHGEIVVHISAVSLGSLTFRAPQLAEQQAIAEVLLDMDAEIHALVRRREKMRQVTQGMRHELLSGRARLLTRGIAA